MYQFILVLIGVFTLAIGSILGYFARQSIARKRADTIETTLQKKISQTKKEADEIISKAREKAVQIFEEAKKERETQHREFFKTEKLLLRRENVLAEKSSKLEEKEAEFLQKVQRLREIKASLEDLKQEAVKNLERVSKLSKEEAKKELFEDLEKEQQKEIIEKMEKLERTGFEKLENRAKEILALAIQKCAFSQAQEMTTTTVALPNEEIKGRIIGKEGRNIRALEQATGCEIVVDETPEAVMISGFDPVRRHIAKIALEKLIHDGRIQPARIEDTVKAVETEIASQIREAGEKVVYDTAVVDLDPKLVQLLGRLKFRTSYGQNVLLHSLEVCYLAAALASELGANIKVARKAGLLHDIGKAVDHQIQGSHTDIGIKILEKFGVEKEVINAMKSHHEEYPAESLEAVLVQTADQISGARPGARKDTLENYLKRLEELEGIALSFKGIEKVYAIQAGREVRVFVKPGEVDDLGAKKLAREIANRIQDELRYPGEIKVTLIRENRIVEYAR
ncbi:MAG: ribonuclease Y [Candidatus Nealsonbacteria bacterium CG10_big_fil_rev_8_21_14_0_10_36_24]|uniref:Ribonuclease Y n=2 Tax=Candidatus Nealsoniibacteriota TaxID=1817911 RepID=A0A2M6NR66_9BACT|nr:MAG: ribonuclease Y [Candidatus Nealsonbacteria bacterium CG10_big_fil_rev_8_21_14_0_10_36_24]